MANVAQQAAPVSVPKSENDSLEHITSIFQQQRDNLQNLKNETVKTRIKKLKKLRKTILAWREKIQQAIAADFKRPPTETDVVEIFPTVSEIKHLIHHIWELSEPESVDVPLPFFGSSSYVLKEPKGNCLIITPWNYPFFLSMSPVATAIATGNAIVLKPSEFSPNTSKLLKELLAEVFPENEIAVIQGDHVVSQQLLDLKFNHIHFTGSPQVGKIIMREASKHLASVTLELGGKSPTIVDETANIAKAAKKIAWGKWMNAGQTCVAPDYVFVHKSKKAEFIAQLQKSLNAAYGNDEKSWANSNDYTHMINQKHCNRVHSYVNDAVEKGATVVIGNQNEKTDTYLSPMVVEGVPLDSTLMQEEIFGPILPILEYDNIDDALKLVNEREKPLALYIFSSKNKNIRHILNHTSAGGTCVNEVVLHVSQPNLPFGGINNSGIGKSHGKWGFNDFVNERAVMRQHLPYSATELLYPPYNKLSDKLISLVMKWF